MFFAFSQVKLAMSCVKNGEIPLLESPELFNRTKGGGGGGGGASEHTDYGLNAHPYAMLISSIFLLISFHFHHTPCR